MSEKVKKVKIIQQDGIFSDYIPIYQQNRYRKFLLTMGNHDSVSAIGAEYDVWMRYKGSMSINYATKTLIDSY